MSDQENVGIGVIEEAPKEQSKVAPKEQSKEVNETASVKKGAPEKETEKETEKEGGNKEKQAQKTELKVEVAENKNERHTVETGMNIDDLLESFQPQIN